MVTPAPSSHGPARTLAALRTRLGPDARDWLEKALADAAENPRKPDWELHFASARRRCGPPAALDARVLLLHAAGAGPAAATRLYHRGTAGEREAVLRALPHLCTGKDAAAAAAAVDLIEDALRTNDTNLLAAAVGPCAAAHLAPHSWRHAVLKCLFTGIPLSAVAGLEQRAPGDAELARMLRDFVHERTAAGRDVPADLRRALDLTGPPAERPLPEES